MKMWIELGLFLVIAFPITIVDIRDQRIPDPLSLGGIALFVAVKLIGKEQTLPMVAAEVLIGFGLFWLIWRFSGGQIGLGDAKYSALIAVAAGLPAWLAALFVASTIGLLFALVAIRGGRLHRRARIPFAPFLTCGAALAIPLSHFIPRLTA